MASNYFYHLILTESDQNQQRKIISTKNNKFDFVGGYNKWQTNPESCEFCQGTMKSFCISEILPKKRVLSMSTPFMKRRDWSVVKHLFMKSSTYQHANPEKVLPMGRLIEKTILFHKFKDLRKACRTFTTRSKPKLFT